MRLDSIKKMTETNLMDKAYNFQRRNWNSLIGPWVLGLGDRSRV